MQFPRPRGLSRSSTIPRRLFISSGMANLFILSSEMKFISVKFSLIIGGQGLAVALVHPRAIATSSSAFLSRQSFQRQNKPSPRPIEESFVDEISGSILSDSERDGKTIFALSSAPGRAGVSILRISGPHASDVCLLLPRSLILKYVMIELFRCLARSWNRLLSQGHESSSTE